MATDGLSPAAQDLFAMPTLLTELVSDGFVPAHHIDPHLVKPWGASFSPTGPFWVLDAGAGVTTIYNGTGGGSRANPHRDLGARGCGPRRHPDGTGLQRRHRRLRHLGGGHSASPNVLFATIEGTISGWGSAVAADRTVIALDNRDKGAEHTGLAIASTDPGELLFAADFHHREVAVYDQDSNTLAPVVGPFLPGDHARFNVQVLDGPPLVAHAQQEESGRRDVPGAGHGYVDEFSLDGTLLHRDAAAGPLASPWGLDLVPASFGKFAGDLLSATSATARSTSPTATRAPPSAS